MHIPSKHVYEKLVAVNADTLHHANSVATACQFLRTNSLVSRGTIERLGIKQTPQDSDAADKKYSIWFDVFTDSVDIHERASRHNAYGPVLFEIDAEIINKTYTGRMWVTKLNPTKWSGINETERWFINKQDLEKNFSKGTFDYMIVFRHCGGELPLKKYLKRIILDDPKLTNEDGVSYYDMAVGALRLAMSDSGLDIPIVKRKCTRRCNCKNYYSRNSVFVNDMFDPKI
ncbi:MAG: hypothetical protein QM500_05355 [Methylococcales bacterium]